MKTELCEAKDYRLLHIFEDKWNDKVKEKLKQIFENKKVIIPEIYSRTWFNLNDKRYSALVYSKLKLKYNYYDCGKIKILRLNDTKYDQI